MKKNITEIIMNPIRLRIVQYLMIHQSGTTTMIKKELCDVPPASLYRHIRILLEAGCIEVIEERKVRGTFEKVYQLVKKPFQEMSEQDPNILIQNGLISLMNSFQLYFKEKDNDPVKDMISFSTSTLMLSDEEYMELLKKIGGLINEVIANQPKDGRKQRRLTFVSSPCES